MEKNFKICNESDIKLLFKISPVDFNTEWVQKSPVSYYQGVAASTEIL